jgi:hypothetical protein
MWPTGGQAMNNTIVLYETTDISRNGLSSVYGSSENVTRILHTFQHITYKDENVTVYGANRVTLSHFRNGLITMPNYDIHFLDEAQLTRFGNTIPFAAIILQKWCYGYYHFTNEILHKILRVYEYNPKIPILLPNVPFIKSIIEYVQIPNPILYFDHSKPYYTIKFGIYISETRSGNPDRADIELVRKYMRLEEPKDNRVGIVIYRKEARRNIQNFDEMMNALRVSFPEMTWVVFDAMPFEACVRLFDRAKLILGAHGAGLSNMMFAPKGTPIIELFPCDMINLCYWHLSWILGNSHSILACSSSGTPAHNLTVNPFELVDLTRKVLSCA